MPRLSFPTVVHAAPTRATASAPTSIFEFSAESEPMRRGAAFRGGPVHAQLSGGAPASRARPVVLGSQNGCAGAGDSVAPAPPAAAKPKEPVATYADLHARLRGVTQVNNHMIKGIFSRGEIAAILRHHSVPVKGNKPEIVHELIRLIEAGARTLRFMGHASSMLASGPPHRLDGHSHARRRADQPRRRGRANGGIGAGCRVGGGRLAGSHPGRNAGAPDALARR